MKQYIWILCMFYVLQCILKSSADSIHDEFSQLVQTSLKDCYEDDENTKQIEMTNEGFEALLKGERNPPRNTKCLRFCIMRKMDLISAENQLNTDEMLTFFLKKHSVDENTLKMILDICKESASTIMDRCERAHHITMCMLNNLKEKGIENI